MENVKQERRYLNYAKTQRKKAGLSQNELAYLFGDKTTSYILKTERGSQLPCLSRLLSYQILFDLPADQLFFELSKSVSHDLFKRIATLSNNLERRPQTATVRHKIQFLESAAARIATNNKDV